MALAGGGGKTTAMFRLAEELRAADRRVVTTMTTKIFVSQMDRAPARLILEDAGELLAQLPALLAEHGHVLLTGGAIVEQDKVQGVTPELLDRVAAHPAVDAVIAEADGSRRLPFKAPAAHEPVIPTSATLVVPVVGIDVLGQPLDADHVHRPELVAALTGAALGDSVTPAMIAAVLAHPQGGAQGIPATARLVPFLNKAEDEACLAAAREIARLLLQHDRIDSVMIGAAQATEPVREVWGRVGAVVLAAGQAKRFGALKQVLPWRGVPLVAHVAGQALACRDIARVAVTVGAEAERVTAALAEISAATNPQTGRGQARTNADGVSSDTQGLSAVREAALQIIPVPNWAEGQSRSVVAGLAALAPSPAEMNGKSGVGVGAALFLLADQPGVTPELLSALIQRYRETLAPVVAPRYAGQHGHPVLFDRATFPEFAGLAGDVGARPILQRHHEEIAWVDWPTPEVLQDIDIPEAYPSQPAA